MRRVFLVLAGLMLLTTGVLLFLAGMGAFDAAPRSDSFAPHALLGRGLFVVALLSLAVAALARMPGRVIGLTALVAGLVVVQSLIAAVARAFDDGGQNPTLASVVFGLHAVNGLITMGVAQTLFTRVRALAAPGRAGAGPVTTAPVAP